MSERHACKQENARKQGNTSCSRDFQANPPDANVEIQVRSLSCAWTRKQSLHPILRINLAKNQASVMNINARNQRKCAIR
jgi:hypothetical protein